jgi:hypothetical protein
VDGEGEVVAEADVASLGVLLWALVGSWGRGVRSMFLTWRTWEKNGEALRSLSLEMLIDMRLQSKTMVTLVLVWSERLPKLNVVSSDFGIMGMSGGREFSRGM